MSEKLKYVLLAGMIAAGAIVWGWAIISWADVVLHGAEGTTSALNMFSLLWK